jgi:anti-anti-sigma factor
VRTRDMRTKPAAIPSSGADDLLFTLSVSRRGTHRVVQVVGELDVGTRERVRQACVTGRRRVVVVEMADITFMDCCGYGALVAARGALQANGGSLTLRNQKGQPADLLTMLSLLEAPN